MRRLGGPCLLGGLVSAVLGCQPSPSPNFAGQPTPSARASAEPARETRAAAPASAHATSPSARGASAAATPVDAAANAPRVLLSPEALAPLGPYPPITDAPACAPSTALAATAPLKLKDRPGWFWPWVVQALLAHDHSFQLTNDLDSEGASERAVTLVEVETVQHLSLYVRCKSNATCSDVVRVLRAAVPGSPAKLACELSGHATGRTVSTDKEALLPVDEQSRSTMAPDSACARLSACARHEDPNHHPRLGLDCQARPAKFPLACAAQYTCFDVANCANLRSGVGPVFSPFTELEPQVFARHERLGMGQYVSDNGGNGGLVAGDILAWVGPLDAQKRQWVILLQSFDASPDSGTAGWSVAIVEPNGVTLSGPAEVVGATQFNAVNLPSFMAQGPEFFDYDGDGSDELLLPVASREHANSGWRALQIWSVKNGSIQRYAGTEALGDVIGYSDFDADGRPDLVLDDDGTLDDQGVHSSVDQRSTSLAHSLPGGKFSTTDRVARSFGATP